MICVPIQADSLEKLKQRVTKVPKEVDLIEIWVDHLPTNSSAKEVLRVIGKKVVIVNKPKREKGKWSGSEEDRVHRLNEFIKEGAAYVDVGIDTDLKLIKKLIKAANKTETKVIISYHNFKKTPSENALQTIVNEAWKLKPGVVKIATFAKSKSDNFILTRLLSKHVGKKRFISLGMGPNGILSRVVGLTLGNEINYIAADSRQKSATGQLTLSQYHKLKDIINFS